MPWEASDILPRARISGAQGFELCKHIHIHLSLLGASQVTQELSNGQTYFMHHHHSAVSENLAWKIILNLSKDSFSGFVTILLREL